MDFPTLPRYVPADFRRNNDLRAIYVNINVIGCSAHTSWSWLWLSSDASSFILLPRQWLKCPRSPRTVRSRARLWRSPAQGLLGRKGKRCRLLESPHFYFLGSISEEKSEWG